MLSLKLVSVTVCEPLFVTLMSYTKSPPGSCIVLTLAAFVTDIFGITGVGFAVTVTVSVAVFVSVFWLLSVAIAVTILV